MSSNKLTADDVLVPEIAYPGLYETVLSRVGGSVRLSKDELMTVSDAVQMSRAPRNPAQAKLHTELILKVSKFVETFLANKELIAELLNNPKDERTISYSGVSMTLSSLQSYVTLGVRASKAYDVASAFGRVPTAEEMAVLPQGDYQFIVVSSPKFDDGYLAGESGASITQRAINLIRRDQTVRAISNAGNRIYEYNGPDGKLLQVINLNIHSWDGLPGITAAGWQSLAAAADTALATPTREAFNKARADIIERQAKANATEDAIRQSVGTGNFNEMFLNVKSAKQRLAYPSGDANDPDAVRLAAEQWEDIPLLEEGTPSSRTWGIEIETVRAGRCTRPRGWEEHSDGSLESDDDYYDCSCNCDNCEEWGDHCDGGHCNYSQGSCAEFVSPVLKHFNSRGLRELMDDIPTDESNTTPGIHVHVGADDLSVADVGRLLAAYGFVSKFLEPLYHREVRGYCKDVEPENVAWWLRQTREVLHTSGRVPTIQQVASYQHFDRYHDVNTEAINKHGTIEFRAMGPYYDYNHLVRWAWFLREMVNVSRLNLPQSVWTSCQSLSDVINVLRQHGSEQSLELVDTTEY